MITGWAADLGGADPDKLRYWLGASVYLGAGIILPTNAIDLIPGLGKGLKVVTHGTELVVVEEASGKALGRMVAENRIRGVAFQSDALTARGIDENTLRITVTLPDGKPVTVIPDTLGRTIIEVKDVKNLSNSDQFRGYLQASIQQEKPIELIVSPKTESISQPLKDLIRRTNGSIRVFDCVFHGTWTRSPEQTGQSERSDAGVVFYSRMLVFVKPLLLFLIESPDRFSLCALCTSRSRMASAKMGSPIDVCQSSTCN